MSGTKPYYPKGQLIPIFAACDDTHHASMTLKLAKIAASRGETVLMLDCMGGMLMREAGIIYNKTLADLYLCDAKSRDVKYVTSNEHFTAAVAGNIALDVLLGSLAALSLDYDWVFVGMPAGCTPCHVRLAGAADRSLVLFSTVGDRFMRCYWMMDAIRRRYPHFDPFLMTTGPRQGGQEVAQLLQETIKEHLGAPPDHLGHVLDPWAAPKALQAITQHGKPSRVA